MAKSKTQAVLDVIDGAHVLGAVPLGDYHAARAVIKALRARYVLSAVRRALRNYRVTVTHDAAGIRVRNPATGKEWRA